MKGKECFRGFVYDRLDEFIPVKRTIYYNTWAEAQRAVEKLAKPLGERVEINVIRYEGGRKQ